MAKKNKAVKSAGDFNIALKGNLKAIDARTLANTLINFNTLIQEINREEGNDNSVSLYVKNFKPGAFDISCAVGADSGMSNTLFGAVNDAAPIDGNALVDTLTDVLTVKEFLGSRKPKSIKQKDENNIVVKNSQGKTKVVSNKVGNIVFNNNVVNVTINNTFQHFRAIPEAEGLVIKGGEGKSQFKTKREHFKHLSSSTIDRKKKTEQHIQKSKVSLSIYKLVFGTNNSWDFYYEGNKVSAAITDEKFHKKMLTGQVEFINGDIMIADIEIVQEFNETAKVFENKKYLITRVHEIKHPAAQSTMELE